jgi:hypothetical protein
VTFLFLAFIAWFAYSERAAWERGTGRNGSDIVRQWKVCQYIRAGRDPWSLAHAILVDRYGPDNGSHTPKKVNPVFENQVLAPYGPPEATYPPSSVGLLTITIGLLPTPEAVLAAWLAVNVLSVLCLAGLVWELPAPWSAEPRVLGLACVAAAFTFFTPFYHAVEAGQFSVICLACLLFAFSSRGNEWVRGIALGVALIKPSIALPFFLAVAVKARWRTIFAAIAVHCVGMAIVLWSTSANPLTLTKQWYAVTGFFLAGTYSLQDVVNWLGWQAKPQGVMVSLLACLLISYTVFLCRRAADEYHLAFLGVASFLWTYHRPYDAICLLPALLVLMCGRLPCRTNQHTADVNRSRRARFAGAVSFLLLSVAFYPSVFGGGDDATRILRWLGRLTLVYVLVAATRVLVRMHSITHQTLFDNEARRGHVE